MRAPNGKGRSRGSALEDVPQRFQFRCGACGELADATQRPDEMRRGRRWKIGSHWSPSCPKQGDCIRAMAGELGCSGDELMADPVARLEPWRIGGSSRARRSAEPLPTAGEVAAWHDRLMSSGKARRRLYRMGFLDETLRRFQIGYGSFHGRPRAFMQPVRNEHGELVQLIESYWPEPWFDLATGAERKSRVLAIAGSSCLYPMAVLTQRSRRPLAVLCITAGRWKAPLMIQSHFDAVTSITGTNWRPEWTRYLEGRCVAVIYDVNEEALAERRAAEFRAAGIDAWAVPLSRAGLAGKEGVDDFLRARSSKRLRRFIGDQRSAA